MRTKQFLIALFLFVIILILISKTESKRKLQSRHTNKRHIPHFVKNTAKNKPLKKVLFKSIQNFSKKKAKNTPPKYKKLKKVII